MDISNTFDVGCRVDTPDGPADVGALACPGCGYAVVDEPPLGWPAAAGKRPVFSHRDGSVLCPDEHGRIGEPYEIRGTGRFGRVAS